MVGPGCVWAVSEQVIRRLGINAALGCRFNINYDLALARPRGVSVAYHRPSAELKVCEKLFSVLSRKVTEPVSRKSNLTFKIHDFEVPKMGYEYKLRCKSHFRDPAGLRPVLAVRVDI